MIKNIPNKYTQKMLLAAIDESFRGTYDFFYLPIDFKNKCNVGYAFINMIRPVYIINFVDRFNYRKWEKFNSEKVRVLTNLHSLSATPRDRVTCGACPHAPCTCAPCCKAYGNRAPGVGIWDHKQVLGSQSLR